MDIVNPQHLQDTIDAIVAASVVASDVELELILPPQLQQVSCTGDSARTTSWKFGGVAAQTSVSCSFVPTAESQESWKLLPSLEQEEALPFKIVLRFTAGGARYLFVQERSLSITAERSSLESTIRSGVVGVAAIHHAAQLAQARRYQDARIHLVSTLRLLQCTMAQKVSNPSFWLFMS